MPVEATVDSQDRVVSYTYVSKARREPVKPQVALSLTLILTRTLTVTLTLSLP